VGLCQCADFAVHAVCIALMSLEHLRKPLRKIEKRLDSYRDQPGEIYDRDQVGLLHQIADDSDKEMIEACSPSA